jgi:cytochrome c2
MRHLLLAAVVSTAVWAIVGPARAQDAAAGQIVFKIQCASCHSVAEGKNLAGPSLYGIVGRKAGQIPTFKYSPANRDAGITWNAATLDRYLASPQAVMPKTIMAYPGLKDARKRANLIAFLAAQHS